MAQLKKSFLKEQNGLTAARRHAKIIDVLLLEILHNANHKPDKPPPSDLALIAVGGYGRGELAPHSDIDILFLTPAKPNQKMQKIIDLVLYCLWDLGLSVGYATRSVPQSLRLAKRDQTVATALLESRLISGDKALYKSLWRRFMGEIIGDSRSHFVRLKLDERDRRHIRMGDTRYVLEPNIKEGKGGLRDLHLIRWVVLSFYRLKQVSELQHLGIFTASDVSAYEKAMNFFLTLRFHLHYLGERANETLTFDAQLCLSKAMRYKSRPAMREVERLMRHYFLHATNTAELTRIVTTALQHQGGLNNTPTSTANLNENTKSLRIILENDANITLSEARLNISHSDLFTKSPLQILHLFELGLRYDLDFHPDVFRAIRKAFNKIRKLCHAPEAYALFLRILTATEGQERILRILGECGFLGRFLPDFGRVTAQMQYDMYHVYTTDEHTIRAIGNLNRIERQQSVEAHPLAAAEIGKIINRRVLYMAVFLHDIAKGQKGDHSQLGAQLALDLCPKFGFSATESELVAWLVLQHLLMSNTAFKRNLDDAKTIENFVAVVNTMEHLRLLLCLTVADITAVGPNVWNNWKAHLIRVLYRRAAAYIEGTQQKKLDDFAASQIEVQKVAARLAADKPDWSEDRLKQFMALGEVNYYLSYTQEQLSSHAEFIFAAQSKGLDMAVDISVDARHSATHLLVYARDSLGLAARLCGAIALSSANIVEARLNVFNNGMVLDSFTVQNLQGRAIDEYSDLARLRSKLEEVVRGDMATASMDARLSHSFGHDPFTVPPRVDTSNDASDSYTLIEVRARDRLGLFFSLCRCLADLELRIGSARLATFGEEAHDVFYVRSENGEKITDAALLENMRQALLEVLK